MELSHAEFEVLIEALEAWENKDDVGDLVASIFSGSPFQSPGMKLKVEADRQRSKEEKKARKERSVVLRAKLIQMRDLNGIECREA